MNKPFTKTTMTYSSGLSTSNNEIESFGINIYRLYLFSNILNHIQWFVYFENNTYYPPSQRIFDDYLKLRIKVERIIEKHSDSDDLKLKEALRNKEVTFKSFSTIKTLDDIETFWLALNKFSGDTLESFLNSVNEVFNKWGKCLDLIEEYFTENSAEHTLDSEEEFIVINSWQHLVDYITERQKEERENLISKVNELEEAQEQRSLKELKQFQSTFRFIEEFLEDREFKEMIKSDLGEAETAFKNGMYKSTVVLCAAIIEALLKEALIKESGSKPIRVVTPIKNQTLSDVITYAQEKGIINNGARGLTEAARHYRNAIHLHNQKEKVGLLNINIAASMVETLNIVCSDILDWHKKNVS